MFIFTNPLSSCLPTIQCWGICQLAQGAISSLSLSKQIVCHRSQPETQPSLAPESAKAQHIPSTGIACFMAGELLSCSVSLAGVACASAFACLTVLWHFGLLKLLQLHSLRTGSWFQLSRKVYWVFGRETCPVTAAVSS